MVEKALLLAYRGDCDQQLHNSYVYKLETKKANIKPITYTLGIQESNDRCFS